MKLEQRLDGWWITNTPGDMGDMGPYTTRKEADEDRQGVERTLKSLEPKKR